MEYSPAKVKFNTAAIVTAFGLRGVLRVRRLRNCPLGTMLIETSRGRYVVRRTAPRSDLELKRTAHFLVYLRDHGFPVLVPLTDRNGRYWHPLGATVWSVHPLREWRLQPFDPGNAPQLAALGESLAHYHMAGKGYRKGADSKLTLERVWQLFAAVQPHLPPYLARAGRVLDEEVRYLCSALDVAKLPRGPILVEMDPHRFCFYGNKLRLVLNCEPDSRGPFIFDLANAVNRFCFGKNGYDLDRFETLVRPYDRVRPLGLLEWDAFPNALRLSAARQLCILLQRAFLDQAEPWAALEPKFHEWFDCLRVLRREVEGRFGPLLAVMATGYDYRRYQRSRSLS
ncbi:MAG: hypothetical protein KatS3mg077_2628 [Candidatus Binatia bacterium]|nr:MAG: hypothetical protein KatS3mg077_2628 [Candidatus Binatia bacterium]